MIIIRRSGTLGVRRKGNRGAWGVLPCLAISMGILAVYYTDAFSSFLFVLDPHEAVGFLLGFWELLHHIFPFVSGLTAWTLIIGRYFDGCSGRICFLLIRRHSGRSFQQRRWQRLERRWSAKTNLWNDSVRVCSRRHACKQSDGGAGSRRSRRKLPSSSAAGCLSGFSNWKWRCDHTNGHGIHRQCCCLAKAQEVGPMEWSQRSGSS